MKRVGEETPSQGTLRTGAVSLSFIHCKGFKISISVYFAEVRY